MDSTQYYPTGPRTPNQPEINAQNPKATKRLLGGVSIVFRASCKTKAWGLEQVPETGPFITAASHITMFDVFVPMMSLFHMGRRPRYMAKAEMAKWPLIGKWFRLVGMQPVQRHSDRARTLLRQAGYDAYDIIIPDAEAGKTTEVANGIWQRLGDEGFTRSDAIVGLGGGAATDLAGFVAATWMRGIRYVNCPTSLLAMVDASTGGKTGINTPQGKNLVGSFYTPAGVLADLKSLTSLPNDIFIEGLGEVAKSGFIMDPEILQILEDHADELRAFDGSAFLDSDLKDVVAELIEHTVGVKAYHVSADLKEAGLREFLNYGHTLGHAIEKLEHFRWRHGNAVAVGCVYAAELSHLLGYIDQDLVDYHRSLLESLGLPTSWNNGTWDDVLALMHRDKKARGNKLRFVVLEGVGKPIHLEDPPADAVEEAFHRIQQ